MSWGVKTASRSQTTARPQVKYGPVPSDKATILVATWNIWGMNVPAEYLKRGKFRGAIAASPASRELRSEVVWARRLKLISAELSAVRADVVALQECSRTLEATSGRSVAPPGMHVSEGSGVPTHVGLSILTAQTPAASGELPLKADLFGYPRPLWADIELCGLTVRVISVHVPLARIGPQMPILEELASFVERTPWPVVVAGDLNMEPDNPILAQTICRVGIIDATASLSLSMPNPRPKVRIDYVLVRGPGVSVHDAYTFGEVPDKDGFLPSDHLGVAAELSFERSRASTAL